MLDCPHLYFALHFISIVQTIYVKDKTPINNFNRMKATKFVAPEGKVVYYKGDGTGRDSYIKNINGGLLSHDRLHSLKNNLQPIRQKAFSFAKNTYGKHPSSYAQKQQNRFVHYISDGSGRDHYVTSTEGGSSTQYRWRDQTNFKFRNTLRAGSKFLEGNPEEDVFMKSQSKFTGTQSRMNRTMSMTQSFKNSELSTPKKYPTPPPLSTYYGKGFDASKEFRKHQYGKNH